MSMTSETMRAIDPCWQRIGLDGDASCPELQQHLHCRNCPTHAVAASALLDRAPPAGYLAEWTGHVARGGAFSVASLELASKREARAAVSSMIIFRLSGEWLALPAALLEEVTEPRPIHSLPHQRSGVVLGITNIHGELLICVSLALLLNLEPGAAGPQQQQITAQKRFLVIGREANRFVVPVDEVHGIRRYGTDNLDPPPATVSRSVSSYTRHVLSWENHTVGCLDGELLIDGLNRTIA